MKSYCYTSSRVVPSQTKIFYLGVKNGSIGNDVKVLKVK